MTASLPEDLQARLDAILIRPFFRSAARPMAIPRLTDDATKRMPGESKGALP